jgi:hypothetical protein
MVCWFITSHLVWLMWVIIVIRHCVRNPSLSPAVHSTVSRLILSVALALPQIPPALLSPDPSLFQRVYKQVRNISVEISTWSTSAMSRGLPLLLQTGLRVNDSDSEVRGFYLFKLAFLKKRFRYSVCSISFFTLASLLSFIHCRLSNPSFLQRDHKTKGRLMTHYKWKWFIQTCDQ